MLPKYFQYEYQKAEFDSDFASVEKYQKVHNFYTVMLITFLYQFFYTIFNGFEISIQFCIFC